MTPQKLLLCGASGFIGRNLLNTLLENPQYKIYATYFQTLPPQELLENARVQFLNVDLRNPSDVHRALEGMDIVLQAAATTSGAKDIVTTPYHHVTDNAIMNSLILRSCYEKKIKRMIFFSCTVMYPEQSEPVKEDDFNYQIVDKYFGVGWTKVYLEKMCEFYSRISPTRYTVIRHSNIYGPHDKYDLEKSHVFGATVAKVMTASDGKIVVWGDGSEERDLLYVDDLVRFVGCVLREQDSPFELINIGCGQSISVLNLVQKIIKLSGKNLRIEFDRTKPTLPFKLALNINRAKERYGWCPTVSLDEGIRKSLEWYQNRYLRTPTLQAF